MEFFGGASYPERLVVVAFQVSLHSFPAFSRISPNILNSACISTAIPSLPFHTVHYPSSCHCANTSMRRRNHSVHFSPILSLLFMYHALLLLIQFYSIFSPGRVPLQLTEHLSLQTPFSMHPLLFSPIADSSRTRTFFIQPFYSHERNVSPQPPPSAFDSFPFFSSLSSSFPSYPPSTSSFRVCSCEFVYT